ncbi:MAG: futalosine hydrolase [Desulfovibrio sp.]|jgi:futalosine hydrolase|nr:futalosine hydrolase [Desulfovibrio sp.]
MSPCRREKGETPRPCFLLVAATVMEMRASIARLPCFLPVSIPDMSRRLPSFHLLPALELPAFTIRLLVCGVGPVAAALSLGMLLGEPAAAAHPLRGIVNIGLAGAYDPRATPPGSLVLASGECLPEYGVWPDKGEDVAAAAHGDGGGGRPLPLPLPQACLNGREIFNSLELDPEAALGNMGLTCHTAGKALSRGVSLTVAGVSGTPGRARRLASLFNGLIENMEGFPLALGALRAGIPFVEIRAVSNVAGLRPPHGWDLPGALDALELAGTILFGEDKAVRRLTDLTV